jgi:hypothetical protein
MAYRYANDRRFSSKQAVCQPVASTVCLCLRRDTHSVYPAAGKEKGRDERGLFRFVKPRYELLFAVALPATLLIILVLPTRRATRLIAATLPATLTALTTLTALLLAVALSRFTRIRASHNTSNAKVNIDSGDCFTNVVLQRRESHPPRG